MPARHAKAANRRRPPREGPARLVALHKPYGVLSQFTPDGSKHRPLAELGLPDDVWPLGRLDADSEGLLLLSSDPSQHGGLLDPERGHPREYAVCVERVPTPDALSQLAAGVEVQGRATRPCEVRLLDVDPGFGPRDPPIRFRKSVPTAWLSLTLTEGRNRQVRRMTAAVGHPTLRLVRVAIGALPLGELAPGAFRELSDDEVALVFGGSRG